MITFSGFYLSILRERRLGSCLLLMPAYGVYIYIVLIFSLPASLTYSGSTACVRLHRHVSISNSTVVTPHAAPCHFRATHPNQPSSHQHQRKHGQSNVVLNSRRRCHNSSRIMREELPISTMQSIDRKSQPQKVR
jgi:hypothetical protein